MLRNGRIEGKQVRDILLDTGCDRTLVWKELVPVEKMVQGEVPIRCAHGDTHMYPFAEVQIEVEGSSFTVEVGVADCLPVSVLLGKDVPEVVRLTHKRGHVNQETDALVVTTRAQAKRQEREATLRETERGRVLVAQPNPVERDSTQMAPESSQDQREGTEAVDENGEEQEQFGMGFDDDLFMEEWRERNYQGARNKLTGGYIQIHRIYTPLILLHRNCNSCKRKMRLWLQ